MAYVIGTPSAAEAVAAAASSLGDPLNIGTAEWVRSVCSCDGNHTLQILGSYESDPADLTEWFLLAEYTGLDDNTDFAGDGDVTVFARGCATVTARVTNDDTASKDFIVELRAV